MFLFEQRAASSVAEVLGFEHRPFIRYSIEKALLENMICPHSCPLRWTKPPPFIGSNQNQLPLPRRVARDGCLHRFTVPEVCMGQNTSIS